MERCTTCNGKGTRTLHGIAITSEEYDRWSEEMRDDYSSGVYDTVCEVCGGAGQVDSEAVRDYYEEQATLRAESPHLRL